MPAYLITGNPGFGRTRRSLTAVGGRRPGGVVSGPVRPRPTKLTRLPELRVMVEDKVELRWSPE